MAGIMIPAVCEQEAAERLTEATNNFSKAQLVEVIKHWESKYELLDKYAKDLAVKNKHWEVSWPYHQKMVITRIEQREAVIKGLTQANQSLVQKNAGFCILLLFRRLIPPLPPPRRKRDLSDAAS
ncbi:hypothetical protein OYC64_011728 [Pagothenia borchgrevinki]|uniref:Uncharacterized protein n=1 Tax=Pagothenia borchgrevinki TaxID=8213 RepID=A0ABD2FGU4_PAGBO